MIFTRTADRAACQGVSPAAGGPFLPVNLPAEGALPDPGEGRGAVPATALAYDRAAEGDR